MMDLAEIGLKSGLFIPTPGQWEQEYLSSYYQQRGWFRSKSQSGISLLRDVEQAFRYSGFPENAPDQKNVQKLYQDLLSRNWSDWSWQDIIMHRKKSDSIKKVYLRGAVNERVRATG